MALNRSLTNETRYWETKMYRRLLVIVNVLLTGAAHADEERLHVPHVVFSKDGMCYARSVPRYPYDPDDDVRQLGTTQVFAKINGSEILRQTYDWYSPEIHLLCGPSDQINVVRIGPLHRGNKPKPNHLAVAFYEGGQLLRQYSTLEIAGGTNAPSENVSVTVSHYRIFAQVPTMVRSEKTARSTGHGAWQLVVDTIDGRTLAFDVETGEFRQ